MTDDHDGTLQSLFAEAEQELAAEEFTVQVLARVDKSSRRAMIGRICLALALFICLALLAAPIQEALNLLTQVFTRSVIDLENRVLSQVLSPLNNISIVLAVGLIGLRAVYRKIFS